MASKTYGRRMFHNQGRTVQFDMLDQHVPQVENKCMLHASNFATLILLLWAISCNQELHVFNLAKAVLLNATYCHVCIRVLAHHTLSSFRRRCLVENAGRCIRGLLFFHLQVHVVRWYYSRPHRRNSGYFEQVHLTPCLCTFGIR